MDLAVPGALMVGGVLGYEVGLFAAALLANARLVPERRRRQVEPAAEPGRIPA